MFSRCIHFTTAFADPTHGYFTEVKAVKKVGGKKKAKVLAKAKIKLGRY